MEQIPVHNIYSLHSIITVFNATFSTSVFTLVQLLVHQFLVPDDGPMWPKHVVLV
jgi:hypothetical protein